MFVLVPYRDNIIYARSDPAGVIEVALGVRRADGRHLAQRVRVCAEELVGPNASEGSCKDDQ